MKTLFPRFLLLCAAVVSCAAQAQTEHRVLGNGVALLTVPGFATNTLKQVRGVLDASVTNNVRHIVLDLRENKGGSLAAATDVISLFIGRETPLWGFRRANEVNVKTNFGTRDKIWTGGLLVLVSSNTASAGELFAAACQTSGRAKVWGQTTRGVGGTYLLRRGTDGQPKREKSGEFFTATGEPVDGRGIKPDLIIQNSLPGEELVAKAVSYLKQADTGSKAPANP